MGSEPLPEASFDTAEGAASGKSAGLLFLDTCSLLDLVRDLTRDSKIQRLDEWCAHAKVIEPGSGTLLKAVSRTNKRVAPSHADKSEFPDCLIIETVFAECESRDVEETSRAVFLSSNVQDYCAGASTRLRPPLALEFQERRLHFASTFGYAAHLFAGDE